MEYVAELKIDGLATSLTYEDGVLTVGATRGDGYRGDAMTMSLEMVKSIPLSTNPMPEHPIPRFAEIRGEVYLLHDEFRRINEERTERGEPTFANPRNAAAGSVRQLDPKVTARRRLDMSATGSGLWREPRGPHIGRFLKPSKRRFKVNPNIRLCQGIDGTCASVPSGRQSATPSIRHRRRGGQGQFASVAGAARLRGQKPALGDGIQIQPPASHDGDPPDRGSGRGGPGALTPVAIMDPVRIGGVTVTRATLHNEDEVRRKDVRAGDTVVIQRAGEVIPEVVEVVQEKRDGHEVEFVMPECCPVCGAQVQRLEGEAVTRCFDIACPARIRETITHFASREAMNIEGMGPSLVERLIDASLVADPGDIYFLSQEDLAKIERMGEKSAANILASIDRSRTTTLGRLIYALAIRHVGERTAQVLAQHFGSLDSLEHASEEELSDVPDVGPAVARSIFGFFAQEQTQVGPSKSAQRWS